MDNQEEKLLREVSGTTEYILVSNGLKHRAKGLCEQFDLRTFEDFGELSAEAIEGTMLMDWQKKSLTELCAHCRVREMYKECRRGMTVVMAAVDEQFRASRAQQVQ